MVKPGPAHAAATAAAAPCAGDHDHGLRAPAFLDGGLAPALLKRTDQDFVNALLAEMESGEGRGKMKRTLAGVQTVDRDAASRLRLWQPVHRVFHLAVMEAVCRRYGGMRLDRPIDPRRIVGSGLVVRRVVERRIDTKGGTVVQRVEQGWMKQDDAVAGWRDLPSERERDQDPDPEKRPPPLAAGHPLVTARLAERLRPLQKPFAETVHPLFVATPKACAASGATLLYGVVPLTSSEITEQQPPPPVADAEGLNALVPEFLLPLPRVRDVQETAVRTFGWSLPADLKAMPPADPEQAEFLARQQDLALLHQLGAFDVPDDPNAPVDPAVQALLDHLNQVAVWDALPEWEDVPTLPEMRRWNWRHGVHGGRGRTPWEHEGVPEYGRTPWGPLPQWRSGPWPMPTRALGDVLRHAARVFRDGAADGAMPPSFWRLPRGAEWHRTLRARLEPLLNRRVDEMTAGVGRYDRAGAQYVARAFVRVRNCDDCPPELVWSATTAPFTIVPWFEPSGAPPTRVQLPEATPESLAKLKPNVAFMVPASLQSVMAGLKVKKPLDVSKGDVSLSMDWLCGFNIPIITLCAFIVLSIFLSLLNMIFWWLPLVKICIPIPKSSPSERL
jgi:hypothetical protein